MRENRAIDRKRIQRDAKDEHDVFIGVCRSLFCIRYAYQKCSLFELDDTLYTATIGTNKRVCNGRAEEREGERESRMNEVRKI